MTVHVLSNSDRIERSFLVSQVGTARALAREVAVADMTDDGRRTSGPKAAGEWRRASRCTSGGCVEVKTGEEISIRSSKHPNGIVVNYDRDEWRAFVEAVKAGEFDV